MASDQYSNYAKSMDAPAENAAAVTPNDTTELTKSPRAIYIGTGGNLCLTTVTGKTVTFVNVQDGCILPVRPKMIRASGTTASDILVLW